MSYDVSSRVVVIGGGIAGLATAGLLARQGHAVTLVEKNDTVGGRAGSVEADGYRWDAGPSWYLMPEAFDHFFEAMGTSTAAELNLVRLDPAYRVFSGEHEPIDVRTGVDQVAELFESIEPGAGEKVRDYLATATHTYTVAVEYFLYTTFQSLLPWLNGEVLRNLTLLVSLLSTSLETWVSRNFTDERLRQILEYPAVFLSSEPAHTPAMYHLLSHTDLVEGVCYPQGGFIEITRALERLARAHGVDIRSSVEVTDILTQRSGHSRVPLQGLVNQAAAKLGAREPLVGQGAHEVTGVRVKNARGVFETLDADIVVAAGDMHHTQTRLLPRELQTIPESSWRRKDPGIGAVLAFLGVDGELPQLLHHQLLLSADWDPDFEAIFHAEGDPAARGAGARSHSIYVCKPSATDPTVAPAGKENLFVLIPVPAAPSIGGGSAYGEESPTVAAIVDSAISQIAEQCRIPDLAGRIEARYTAGPADFASRYYSWKGNAIGLAHTLTQSAFLRGTNASSKVRNLLFAGGTTVPGVGVPMCLISAENVLKRLQGDTSVTPS
ncbi:phytoene desaturase [Corynebacterium sp. 13CS0277]|uniref:phytoene desaturase family protein n=1 Tax=Corynebacterium sp. 13CS0277 TaxID=2071994 RepID=UPI000D025838|nr:phytoene desaturase family protein [Corynebacterium sp. 13CS0277]PRQ10870.1 phytoene desaturase [Corynebacterium sp. 13CS0277]